MPTPYTPPTRSAPTTKKELFQELTELVRHGPYEMPLAIPEQVHRACIWKTFLG